MLPINTIVTFADFIWETGKQLIEVDITLGSAEKSSSCKVTIADPYHIIAERCINHSIKAGGIVELVGTEKTKDINIPGAKPETGQGTGNTKGWVSPEEHAFADACVKREPNGATTDIPMSYRSKNQAGFYPASILLPGAGFPAEAGKTQNIGRYQVNRGDWQEAVNAGYAKDFTPEDQDGVFRYKIYKGNRGGAEFKAGNLDAAFQQASNEWVSMPWNTKDKQQQPGTTKAEYVTYYNQQLAAYKGTTALATTPKTKVAETKTPVKPSTTDTATPVVKGTIISINVNGYIFEFYHQGTEMSESGTTVLTGQGLRWLMSRRPRSRTVKDITLKQLAEQVAKQHKVKLDYQAKLNPAYSHVDQSGISDYALLLREAESSGLMITEDMKAKTLVVKERAQLGQPTYTLERGLNLISYKISDKALSGQEKAISAFEPTSAKVTIDPVTGKHISSKPEVDRLKSSNTPTGKVKPKVGGTLTTNDNVTSSISQSKTKRIAGLPSTFVVPMSSETLSFSPLTTMLTKGFPGCLDRIWVVKTVTHSISEGNSTLVLNSPVEVKDNGTSAPTIPGAVAESAASGTIPDRIYKAALASRGKNTANDGTNGVNACAWAVNGFTIQGIGLKQIGTNRAAVASMTVALTGGRGRKVTRAEAIPGDILIMGTSPTFGRHVGIYLGNNRTLSNSSSKAAFVWEATYEEYQAAYDNVPMQYWRVLS